MCYTLITIISSASIYEHPCTYQGYSPSPLFRVISADTPCKLRGQDPSRTDSSLSLKRFKEKKNSQRWKFCSCRIVKPSASFRSPSSHTTILSFHTHIPFTEVTKSPAFPGLHPRSLLGYNHYLKSRVVSHQIPALPGQKAVFLESQLIWFLCEL